MKYCAYIILLCILAFSCQVKHLVTTHNTPYFTKGNQLEGGVNLGFSGGQLNLAYTPVKYFALQANAGGFLGRKYTEQYINRNVEKQHFCNYAEGAVGGYYPFKKSLLALNIGYGEGATDWLNNSPMGVSGYTLNEAKFDSKNTFFHIYYAANSDSGRFIQGVSFKLNSYTDRYYYGSSIGYDYHLEDKVMKTQNIGILYYMKLRLAKHFYFHMSVGPQFSVGYSEGEDSFFATRFGIVIR